MEKARNLTAKQKKVLDFISEFMKKNGKSPLIREIQKYMGFRSTRSVTQHLDVLAEKGYIRKSREARSIELVDYYENVGSETVLIPLRGAASCGDPAFWADDNIEGHLSVDKALLSKGNVADYYLLRTRGKSMDRAGIRDSSIVLVRKKNAYEDKKNIVAVIDGRATVKQMRRGNSAVMLVPMSSERRHKPIILSEGLHIAGQVVAVLPEFTESDVRYVPIEEN